MGSHQQPKEPKAQYVDPKEADSLATKIFWIVLGGTVAYAASVLLFIN